MLAGKFTASNDVDEFWKKYSDEFNEWEANLNAETAAKIAASDAIYEAKKQALVDHLDDKFGALQQQLDKTEQSLDAQLSASRAFEKEEMNQLRAQVLALKENGPSHNGFLAQHGQGANNSASNLRRSKSFSFFDPKTERGKSQLQASKTKLYSRDI